jgi:hypothetical protein
VREGGEPHPSLWKGGRLLDAPGRRVVGGGGRKTHFMFLIGSPPATPRRARWSST